MTLSEAAVEFGVARITLQRKLVAAELAVGDGETYTIVQIHRALVGSLEAERIREISARADLLELERLEKQRDLVPMAVVSDILRDVLLPIRQRLLALPAEAASRVNPADPKLALDGLQRWVDDSLPLIRERIPAA